MTEYTLPKAAVRACASVYDDHHEPYYTADQMQQAYAAGREEIEKAEQRGREAMREDCVTRLLALSNTLSMGPSQRTAWRCAELLKEIK